MILSHQQNPPRPGELFNDSTGMSFEVMGIQTGEPEFKIMYRRKDGNTYECYLEAFLIRFKPVQAPRDIYGRPNKDQTL